MIASTINTMATPNLTLLVITVSLRYSGVDVLRCDLNHKGHSSFLTETHGAETWRRDYSDETLCRDRKQSLGLVSEGELPGE